MLLLPPLYRRPASSSEGAVREPASACASGFVVVADDCADVALANDGERDDTAEAVRCSVSPGAPGGTAPWVSRW